ncbi:DUF2577 family protein [Chengkuizengella marina]|uniref:DUF2577 domain-containing protein n=1 Tax=Chengkuizengella marina TaxID=2507566 RepID=A0A6N9Q8B7_9BACL|nr:DUF2577 family protein [Chengkuizengella marina]NBI30903.1 DUF2577 domain-containing protein [Chengkuizengella marina]
MKNIDKLAQMFKERENQDYIGVTIGNVISTSPLRISYGQSVILESRHLVISKTFFNSHAEKGDKVMMMPDNKLKKWYVIDTVVSM